jgi:hypothetical protein
MTLQQMIDEYKYIRWERDRSDERTMRIEERMFSLEKRITEAGGEIPDVEDGE